MPKEFSIRRATPEDKEAVLAFCRQTWEWGDYIGEVWDRWMSEPQGRLLVGVLGGRPVAVGHVRLVAPGEAWLQGMRVDPAYRRRGLGTAFTECAVATAAELCARVARLSTLASNYPVHRVMDRLGFRRVGAFLSLHREVAAASPSDAASGDLVVLEARDLPAVMALVARSPISAAMGGLYCADWVCHTLTEDKLRKRLATGDVVALRRQGALAAVALLDAKPYSEDGLLVEYADGEGDALTCLAAALADLAAARGLSRVTARLPHSPLAIKPFEAAGYARGDHEIFWIFEKHL